MMRRPSPPPSWLCGGGNANAGGNRCGPHLQANGIDFKPPDRLLSYLPLAHVFDRCVQLPSPPVCIVAAHSSAQCVPPACLLLCLLKEGRRRGWGEGCTPGA